MSEEQRLAFDKCVARIKAHKEKCDYREPEMESILWADALITRVNDTEGLQRAIYEKGKEYISGFDMDEALLFTNAVRDYVMGEGQKDDNYGPETGGDD